MPNFPATKSNFLDKIFDKDDNDRIAFVITQEWDKLESKLLSALTSKG
jgi:hypothetical protein